MNARMATSTFAMRDTPRITDAAAIRAMVETTGFFRSDEADVAQELIEDRIKRADDSDYLFVLADDADGSLVGYACYGEIACTVGSYDLYWIVVDPRQQGRGLGRALVHEVERQIAAVQGRRIYIETSSLEKYAPTRAFYLACGYTEAARLPDFYTPGDAKVIYVKDLAKTLASPR
jgi:ribosomal protein S18 acetylase RimI-like enzyme